MPLAVAAEHLERRQYRQALTALITAWRTHPIPALAERIDRYSAWLAAKMPALTDDATAWMQLASRQDVLDQPVLAAALERLAPTAAVRALEWLAYQPTDPRWTPVLLALAKTHWVPRVRVQGQLCRRALKLLLEGRDPRAVLGFEAAGFEGRDYWRVRAEDWLARLEAACPAPIDPLDFDPWDAAWSKHSAQPAPTLEQLRPAPKRRTEADLLEMIYAEPGDLDARLVYADWLEQRGAPRAEFIRLQMDHLAGQTSRRSLRAEADLLMRHEARWLGALAGHVSDVEWRAGFPAGASIELDDLRVLDAPEWSTLTEAYAGDARVLLHPHLAGVRVYGRSCGFLEKARAPVPVHAITLEQLTDRPAEHLVVGPTVLKRLTPEDWPHLHTLEIAPEPREAQASVRQLEGWSPRRLRIWRARETTIERYLALQRIQRFEFMLPAGTLRLALERSAQRWRLEVVWMGAMPCRSLAPAPALARALDVEQVVIRTPFYRHSAGQMTTWPDLFDGVVGTVELPEPRGVRSTIGGQRLSP